MKADKKTAKQVQAEKAEAEKLIHELDKITSKIPSSVMNGIHQVAVSWKEAAKKARSAISAANPRLPVLRAAYENLRAY